MSNAFAVIALSLSLLLTPRCALAGAGNDQPTNIVVNSPYSNNINWAQLCWNTTNASDSLVMIGESNSFSRQVYDASLTTNHCVVVKNLEPSTLYYYSVASCTDPIGGKPCVKTDTNWSSAPWPTTTPTFNTVASSGGSLGFNAFIWGPSYVYQNSGINLGVSLIQTGGLWNSNDVLMLTRATIDGQSCLPGALLGATCGDTDIAFSLLCDSTREEVNAATNNYPVYTYKHDPYIGNYFCWNHYFAEPAVEARIVPGQQSRSKFVHRTRSGSGDDSHDLSMTFQIVDCISNIPVGPPHTVTWQFSVKPPAQFTVTPPTTFPPIPNYNVAIAFAAQWAPQSCEQLKSANQQGTYLNGDLTSATSLNDPWDIYTYDGNRVFKEMGDRFDGVTGAQWQRRHAYAIGDTLSIHGYNQVAISAGNTGHIIPNFSSQPGDLTPDEGTLVWGNAGNKAYWNACSEIVGTQYLNWAVNIARWNGTKDWNVFPWGMYMDFQRQGDVLNENCNGQQTCSGLNATSHLRFGANILSYPEPGFKDEEFTYTYYKNQVGTIRGLPYNTNVTLAHWLETGVQPANEIQKRVDLLLQTIAEAIQYDPLDGDSNYTCCYSPSNWNVGLLAMSLIDAYDVQQYTHSAPDARIPIELMKLLDWFYSTQFNQLGNDYHFPYQPWAVPYNCSIFGQDCWINYTTNNLISPAYAWLGAVYGDSCTLPTSGVKCWTAADQLFAPTWHSYGDRLFNQLFQEFSNFVGWRTGAFPGTDSYVLPTHNPPETPYPDVIGPYPSGAYPAKPTASNISNSGATITWYTFERAVSTVVKVGTDPNNINIETDCGPSVYTNTDNLWINSCDISGLRPNTRYYFGVGGTDAANNFAFSAVDPTINLQGDTFKFKTTQ